MIGLEALCEKMKGIPSIENVPATEEKREKIDAGGNVLGWLNSFDLSGINSEEFQEEETQDAEQPSMLSQASEYMRQSYCDILAAIASQSTTSPAARDFLSLIMQEAAVQGNVTDAVRRGMESRMDDYEAFAQELRTSPLRYRFMLDGFLLTMEAGGKERQQDMLSKWGRILGITFEEGKYLFLQAAALI